MIKKNSFLNLIYGLFTIFLLIIIIKNPNEIILAASNSLTLWYKALLPTLFPFMCGVGILSELGIPIFIGKFLNPIMYPLFGVSGKCAFPWIMGLISGYPMGAKITNDLFHQGEINANDSQKILSFCNNPGPLFVIGTAACVMLKNKSIGYLLMICIFLSSLTTGIIFRFFNTKNNITITVKKQEYKSKDTKNILGNVIYSSIVTISQIGGFVVIFGIIIKSLEITGISNILVNIFSFLPVSKDFISGIISGIFEITSGIEIISNSSEDIILKLIAIGAILSWSGISIISQSFSILSECYIKKNIYIFSRLINSLFTGVYVYLLFPFFENNIKKAVPAILIKDTAINYINIYFLFFLFSLIIFVMTKKKV